MVGFKIAKNITPLKTSLKLQHLSVTPNQKKKKKTIKINRRTPFDSNLIYNSNNIMKYLKIKNLMNGFGELHYKYTSRNWGKANDEIGKLKTSN